MGSSLSFFSRSICSELRDINMTSVAELIHGGGSGEEKLVLAIQYAGKTIDIPFPMNATLGDLRQHVEDDWSVAKKHQTYICQSKKWAGVAFDDSTKLLDCLQACERKPAKEVSKESNGYPKKQKVMLMAPKDASGNAIVTAQEDKFSSQVKSHFSAGLDDAAAAKSVAKSFNEQKIRDLNVTLAEISEVLDSIQLCGKVRQRRKELLAEIRKAEDALAPRT